MAKERTPPHTTAPCKQHRRRKAFFRTIGSAVRRDRPLHSTTSCWGCARGDPAGCRSPRAERMPPIWRGCDTPYAQSALSRNRQRRRARPSTCKPAICGHIRQRHGGEESESVVSPAKETTMLRTVWMAENPAEFRGTPEERRQNKWLKQLVPRES